MACSILVRIAAADGLKRLLMHRDDRIDLLDVGEIAPHPYEEMLEDLVLAERQRAAPRRAPDRIVEKMVEADADGELAGAVLAQSIDAGLHGGEVRFLGTLSRQNRELQLDRSSRLEDLLDAKMTERHRQRHDVVRDLIGRHRQAAIDPALGLHDLALVSSFSASPITGLLTCIIRDSASIFGRRSSGAYAWRGSQRRSGRRPPHGRAH